MLSSQYIGNNMRASAWSAYAEKNSNRVPADSKSPKYKNGSAFSSSDRCCTTCAGGLFLPRQVTDSDHEPEMLEDIASMSLSINVASPARASTGHPTTPERSNSMSPSWSSSRRLERFERQRLSSLCGDTYMPEVARFRPEELILGKKYGKGGSASVYEVTGFAVLPSQDAVEQIEAMSADPRQQRALRDAVTGAFPNTDRYVVKKLSSKVGAGLPDDKYARACAINLVLEANVLRMLDHPNILKLHGMSAPDDEAPFLVLDCLPESLEQRILHWRQHVSKLKKQVSTSTDGSMMWRMVSAKGGSSKHAFAAHIKLRKLLWERIHVGRDIALAVAHMHSKGIVYRDLKCSNIGFDTSGLVKIFDFGISRFLPRETSKEENSFNMCRAGTKLYMSPEVMCEQGYRSVADVYKTDVYSFGVLLWQLLSMSTPQPRVADVYGFLSQVIRVEQFPLFEFPMCPCWPMEIQDLLQLLMDLDPKDRPTMDETHVTLTAQLQKLKRFIRQQDTAPVASTSTKKPRLGRQATFEGSIDLDMPTSSAV